MPLFYGTVNYQKAVFKMNKKKNILILAIETSCDETCASVVANGRKILSNVISSQINTHALYGGVVPEIASRKHIQIITFIIDEAINQAKVTLDDLDAIAVTYGPGLISSLLVGVSVAKGLSFAKNKPLIAVNHIESHIFAAFLEYEDLTPPFLSLIVSGGHTSLIKVYNYNKFEVVGQTRDDAAGEIFDKVARVMSLAYPGGPEIEKKAKNCYNITISFPKPKFKKNCREYSNNYDFSFSGIKSAVISFFRNRNEKELNINDEEIAAAFQQTVCEYLAENTMKAAIEFSSTKLVLAGGVASNEKLRSTIKSLCNKMNIKLYIPTPILCTDNAAMVAARAYRKFLSEEYANLDLDAKSIL